MLIIWAEMTSIPLMQSLQKLILVEGKEGTGVDKHGASLCFLKQLEAELISPRNRMFALL